MKEHLFQYFLKANYKKKKLNEDASKQSFNNIAEKSKTIAHTVKRPDCYQFIFRLAFQPIIPIVSIQVGEV